ncbi:hypothetical protein [Vibrio parahaemolyticus]|uniref:hypothetical protein n=1 Tax=Vibrio parahaemolyticus TaxID=670 RepID=UPI00389182F7
MEEQKRYPLKRLSEELKARDFMAHMKRIIDSADELGLDADGVISQIKRDYAKIELEINAHNQAARDNIIRRELKLADDAIITPSHFSEVFSLFSRQPWPQE